MFIVTGVSLGRFYIRHLAPLSAEFPNNFLFEIMQVIFSNQLSYCYLLQTDMMYILLVARRVPTKHEGRSSELSLDLGVSVSLPTLHQACHHTVRCHLISRYAR